MDSVSRNNFVKQIGNVIFSFLIKPTLLMTTHLTPCICNRGGIVLKPQGLWRNRPSTPSANLSFPFSQTATCKMSSPRIAVITYSMYGHIAKLAESVKAGIESKGGKATIYQVPETLSEDVLALLHAPTKPDYPIATPNTLTEYDGFLLGIPTRFGSMPAQFKSFWDATGALWASGSLAGKYAGIFVSTSGLGGGQEVTVLNSLSTLAHHGIIYVPLGYSHAFGQLTNLEEVHGGSPWGAGTLSSPTGARQPSALELEVAKIQGAAFYDVLAKTTKA
ncbi:flavoprotein-like protein [Flammula alnicola]|nr:flavoprotein-like protein [Flammula alnicola]